MNRISIPKPCHEDWNDMTPNEQGRFCGSCAKTVTDFTGMSASEIQSYLLENSGTKVCGRFKSTQLDTITITIPERVLYSQTKFRNIFLLALLVTMGTTLFSCKDKNQTIGEIAIAKDSTIVDSMDAKREMRHTVGMTTVRDSVPFTPLKKSCGPGKEKERTGAAAKDIHLTGAVAVDSIPLLTDPALSSASNSENGIYLGEPVFVPKKDTVAPPSKIKTMPAPKSNPDHIKFNR